MTTTSVTRLKELLFDTESQRLEDLQRRIEAIDSTETQRHSEATQRHGDLQRRVDQVFDRAGTEDRLQKSVAAILDGALRDAEVSKHEQLSQAVAPLVVDSIKFELKNSQDEMVDALYPLTGKLVKQYVSAEMARLSAQLNSSLGGGSTTPSDLEARAKSLNMSVADLVLAESHQMKVDELFLIRRGSGDLVAHWERTEPSAEPTVPSKAGSNRDVLIAGYLSGITAFSEEAFDDKKGSLRSLDMDGERIFVRASPAYVLAARCSGRAPEAVEQVINDEFVRVVTDYRQALAIAPKGQPPADVAAILPTLAASFERRFAEERATLEQRARTTAKPAGHGRLYALAAGLLLPLVAWGAWSAWQTMETNRVQTAAQRVLTTTPELRGFPVQIDVQRGGKAMTVTGLMPTMQVRDDVLQTLKRDLSGTDVRGSFGLLPVAPGPAATPVDPAPELLALRRDLAAARQQTADALQRLASLEALRLETLNGQVSNLNGQISTMKGQVSTLTGQVSPVEADLQRLSKRLDAWPMPVTPKGQTPREELESFARANALFFLNGIDLVDETRAATVIDQIAALLAKTDTVLRVIGYTDERGQAAANAVIAQSRADRIVQMVAARGIPRERLIALGRTGSTDLSRATGPGSANRRVSFEIGYIGEPATP
jgi:outer membrane protein OmpA-like peptidoglycan-associated protein